MQYKYQFLAEKSQFRFECRDEKSEKWERKKCFQGSEEKLLKDKKCMQSEFSGI